METINSFIGAVQDKISELTGSTENLSVPREEVIALEEAERQRRLDQAASSRVAEINGNKAAELIKAVSFPVFKGNTAGGYKRYTANIEESERQRRLTTKSESTLRKGNARKASGYIKSLGWPFYHASLSNGAQYIFPDVTEEERTARLSNPWAQLTARNNAALVANIIRLEFSHNSSNFGTKRWTKSLEEKERSRRLNDRAELSQSARNAFNLSKIIRNLGWPFFIQESEKADPTIALEEKERERRLANKAEQQLARENAGKVFSTLHQDVSALEDKEKERRVADFGEQQHARELARLVSSLVVPSHKEESHNHKRKYSLYARENARKVSEMIDGLGLSLASIKHLEERERKRRVADVEGQAFARANAKKVSSLFSGDFGAKNLNSLEEEERTRRMWDRQAQMIALSNARKVSRLITEERRSHLGNKKTFTASLEEKERNRRMLDRSYQQLARAHALKLSGLVSADRGFDSEPISIPIQPLAEPSWASSVLPIRTPTNAVAQSSFGPVQKLPPLVGEIRPLPTTVAQQPFTTILPGTQSRSYTSAPVAPVLSSASPTYSTAPIYSSSTYNSAFPTTTPVTSFPASGLKLHTFSDAQRQKLEKQAGKHNKKAEKESAKASKQLAKAEKMHTKGKEAKAAKLETKAEQHTVAAKHHQLWAKDLARDAAPLSLQPQVYRPAM